MPNKEDNFLKDFSLICNSVTLDAYSQKWSFVDVTDEFLFSDEAPDQSEFSEKKPYLVPLSFKMVFRWRWKPARVFHEGGISPKNATVRFISPKGNVIVKEKDIPFIRSVTRPGHFTGVIEVRNFPISGWGQYEISVTPNGHPESENSVHLSIGRYENAEIENKPAKKKIKKKSLGKKKKISK